ncbi:DNA helicase UvrD [Candidatus Bathyarchaeota archaeon]|nr:DNA helicase UvrD [Candidatus Bathyarchaeota archaeon]
MKGLHVIGTGDALHRGWLGELKQSLEEIPGTGLYKPKKGKSGIFFMAQTEVGTVFDVEGKMRHVHHVILMKSLEVAEQLRERLSKYGDLDVDGRPILSIRPAELVEIVLEIDRKSLIYPAHAWTPWRSIFGSINGVRSMEECYEDATDCIHALETGMSSDPSMNWRISALDKYTLISASDAHSPWPFRIGREACVFELQKLSYGEIRESIVKKDPSRLLMTIEVDPAYGKYHFSGHRNCGIGPLSHKEASRLGYLCPVCHKRLTMGVEGRIEELADRDPGFRPPGAIGYMSLLPLHEILALGEAGEPEKSLYSEALQIEYERIVRGIGSEFKVLIEASKEELAKVAPKRIVDAILKLREGKIRIIRGYDGVYGKPVFDSLASHERDREGLRKFFEGFP